MKRVMFWARWLAVTIGIVLLSSVTVDATLGGRQMSQTALGILATTVSKKVEAGCAEGTVSVAVEGATLCVDLYEASPEPACPMPVVGSINDTRSNMTSSCKPVSRASVMPWTFVTQNQAQELCARAGKRLLSSEEWYAATLGTPDGVVPPRCNTHTGSPAKSGSMPECVSGFGVYDSVGNVWEWVAGSVENNTYEGRTLPQSGYIAEADSQGMVTRTAEAPSFEYHDDYFFTTESGVYGMLRGGFFGSETDAGVYTIQAKTAPSFAGDAVGFRCVYNL